MKKLLLVVPLIVSAFVLSGCSGQSNNQSPTETNGINNSSEESVKNTNDSTQTASSYSSGATETYIPSVEDTPLVTYAEIKSGIYNNQKVHIKCTLSDVSYSKSGDLSFDAWVKDGDGLLCIGSWLLPARKVKSYSTLADVTSGDSFQFGVYIYDDSSINTSDICCSKKIKQPEIDITKLNISDDNFQSKIQINDKSQQPESEEIPSPIQSVKDLSNVLMVATIHEAKVLNGFKTKSIGTRAYIEITKDELKNVTNEQYAEFIENAVEDSGYNWFTIFCDDGTGITFTGSMGFIAEYGVLDSEGSVAECLGYITLSEDGYIYEVAE